MATYERPIVVGVFEDRDQAERAIEELRRAGFSDDEIGFALRGETSPAGAGDVTDADAGADAGTRAGEGAVTGMVTGGLIGGLLAAGASLLIPGIGPIIGGGILATILGGAAAGAAAGGLLGALTGLGVPEEEARYYESEFQSGRTIVTVKAGERYREAADILNRHSGYDMESRQRAASFAAHPTSTAINETATAAGTPAAGATATSATPPLHRDAEPAQRTPAGATPVTNQDRAAVPATPGDRGAAQTDATVTSQQRDEGQTGRTSEGVTGRVGEDIDTSKTGAGTGTTPVAHGAPGPPLQQHQEAARLIHGEEERHGAAGTAGGSAEAGTQEAVRGPSETGGEGARVSEHQGTTGTPRAGSDTQELPRGTTTVSSGGAPAGRGETPAGPYGAGEGVTAADRAMESQGSTVGGRAETASIGPDAGAGGPAGAASGRVGDDLDTSKTGAGTGTTPVAHGAPGPPLQQHQEAAKMIHGEEEP